MIGDRWGSKGWDTYVVGLLVQAYHCDVALGGMRITVNLALQPPEVTSERVGIGVGKRIFKGENHAVCYGSIHRSRIRAVPSVQGKWMKRKAVGVLPTSGWQPPLKVKAPSPAQ